MTGRPDDRETADLRRQIEDLDSALKAIRSGGVDAVVLGERDHEQIYTLSSADRPYRVIVEEMGEGAATVSGGGIVLYANVRLAQLLNRDRGTVVGRPVAELVKPEDRTTLSTLLSAAPGTTARAELEFLRSDARPVPALVSVVGLDIEGAVVRCIVVSDLSRRKAAEQQLAAAHSALTKRAAELEAANALLGVANDGLRETERALARSSAQFAAAFECTPVGMALVALDRTILRANPAFGTMTGHPPAELQGMGLDQLTGTAKFEQELFADLAAGGTDDYRCEVQLLRADGTRRWAAVSVARVRNIEGPDYTAFHVEDISERKHFERQLQYLADHDPLTGLLNRRRLTEELEHALAIDARYAAGGALALLDLDGFKYINDTLGHPTGDALLGVVSTAIRSRLRGTDVLSRLGGDEFAVLLYGVDGDGAAALVNDLLAAIREQGLVTDNGRVRTSASVGIALLDGSAGATADEVLANADLAMYAAKAAGGDGLLVYDASGPAAALSRAKLVWIDRVRHALEDDLFTLLAQPILDLERQEVRGCELLLRMRDGDELVEPDQFLPIAERHGLAAAIDAAVIRKGIALVAELGSDRSFRWEINICGASLADPELPRFIEEALERHAVAPSSLVFEITETSVITNMIQAQEFAARVTALGCGFALDDFGAGYGGFYYLKHLPLDYLKIDGEFIRDLLNNPTNRVIVRAMVAAAQPLGKQTIAEYVLDQATCDLLRELHVDHAQGYFVGAPMDPAQLLAELPRFPRLVDLTERREHGRLNRL